MSTYIYEEGAIHNDHHKEMTVNVTSKTDIVSLMKAFMANDVEDVQEVSAEEMAKKSAFPDILCTPDAKAIFDKLHKAGIVDAEWQPTHLSNAEKGTLVEYVADKLNIHSKWKLFGTLWGIDSETLRTSKARGLEQEKTWAFRNKLSSL